MLLFAAYMLADGAFAIVAGVRAAGYRYVALDLAGYVRGGVAALPMRTDVIDLVSLH